jgi:uridine kinase
MKIAVLIAGYFRNYNNCINYVYDEIVKKYDTVDIYLHITNSENKEDKYFNQIKESDIKLIVDKLKPISVVIEDNQTFSNDIKTNNLLNYWYKFYRLNALKKLNEKQSSKYDVVVKIRPDLDIKTKNLLSNINDNVIHIPIDSKIDKSKLINDTDNYICDAISYGDSKIMDEYFNIFNNINEYIIKYGNISETLLYKHLLEQNIPYILVDVDYDFILSKCNVFAIAGDSGSGKTTLSNLLQSIFINSFKLECDRYHKWERGDKNWDYLTHLNPKANHITKMKEDIFNLRIGNDVYQVDYNHNNGKFTQKQLISPSNNLIVCGLHSLYLNENHLYDLKIYMDTQDKLKTKWKIDRDVKERGYTVESVLNTINKRKSDFNQFIEPQKNNADLIVRFFTVDDVNYNDLNHETNVSLSLTVNTKFDISKILDNFKTNNINYSLLEKKMFNIVTFKNYIPLNFLNHNKLKTNNFYEYVLYFIINMR